MSKKIFELVEDQSALLARRKQLIGWASSCLDAKDWHGLRDAASDLEVIDGKLDTLGGVL